MTENKRFTVKQRQGATNYSIIDYYGELPLSEGMYYKSNAEKLCKWLNTQHELLNAFCKENNQLEEDLDYYKAKCASLETGMFNLERENEQLKGSLNFCTKNVKRLHNDKKELINENEQLKQQVNHLKMYKNLFREFQKQLDGVNKKSDLDHKDFDDLVELAKGHVFDYEHGWIWLPVNDR